VDIIRASSVEDIAEALTTGDPIDGDVYYVGHASNFALHPGEQAGFGTNLDFETMFMLPREHNMAPDSKFTILGCDAGAPSEYAYNIAEMIARKLDRDVIAWPVDMLFSPDPNSSLNLAAPGSRPPADGPLYMVPVTDGVRPITHSPPD
jgi:hypothetical protein